MEKFFLTVLNISLTASFIIIFIVLARLLLKKAPKIVSYVLWVVAVICVGFALNRITDGGILGAIMPMSMNNVQKEPHFAGTVTEVYNGSILVKVNEGENVRRSSDLINVSLDVKLKDSITQFIVGDEVIVYYNGEIAESYPAQINTVYAIALTSPDMRINLDSIYALSEIKTPYVGDNGAVGRIIDVLPRLDREHTQRFFSIGDDYGTGKAPFTLTVYYEPSGEMSDNTRNITLTPKNSALLFALIGNLREVNYAFRTTPSVLELYKPAYTSRITVRREDITEYLASVGLVWEDFQNDWNGSVDKLFAPVDDVSQLNLSVEPEMIVKPEITDGSIIRITNFEAGNNCTLHIEIHAPTGDIEENSGAQEYEVIGNTKLVLATDVLVNYIDYDSDTNRNTKKLISYLSQGGSYFPDPTLARLVVHTDESGNNITELTEIYNP